MDGVRPPRRIGVEIVLLLGGAAEAFWSVEKPLELPAAGPTSWRLARLPVGARVTVDGELIHVEGGLERLRVQDLAPVRVADPPGVAVGEFCRVCGADRGEACHSRCPLRGDPPPVSGSGVRDSAPEGSGGARAHGASSGRDEQPRTFELTWLQGAYRVSIPCYLKEGERVSLIELEPVLDLLTRFYTGDAQEEATAEGEMEALLRAHGRLQEPA